jgi:hypothetical protein
MAAPSRLCYRPLVAALARRPRQTLSQTPNADRRDASPSTRFDCANRGRSPQRPAGRDVAAPPQRCAQDPVRIGRHGAGSHSARSLRPLSPAADAVDRAPIVRVQRSWHLACPPRAIGIGALLTGTGAVIVRPGTIGMDLADPAVRALAALAAHGSIFAPLEPGRRPIRAAFVKTPTP